jgi:GntR family transcriptional repressor for pyruvate dehydrogenase complex
MTQNDDISLAPDSASESAERYVRALIYWGELGPGDKLPPATELAARLGISRATLRVALKTLERAGFLVTTRGAHGGSRVSDATSLTRAWIRWMADHGDELEAIFEFRRTIESRLAALAAQRRDDDDLAAIECALASERDNRQRASLFQADADIHRSIARAAHSPRLAQAMNDVRAELFLPVDQALLEHRESFVYDSHAAIVAAIRERDAERAAVAAAAHVDQILELILRAAKRADVPAIPR